MATAGLTKARAVFDSAPCDVDWLPGGGFVVWSSIAAVPHREGIFEILGKRAELHGSRVLFRESDHDGIVGEVTFAQAYRMARRIGRTLLDLGASAERPVALLAENSIAAAMVILGCYAAGVPVAPISPAYSKLSSDFAKLRYVLDQLTPAIVILDDGAEHTGAVAGKPWGDTKLAALKRPPNHALCWDDLLGSDHAPDPHATPDPDGVAKILFTSGSTGMPKGVINTQRMMMSNQLALAQVWPGIFEAPPRLVDWLPWNHTYGGNQIFNMPIVFGGSLTIDRGRPTPDGIATMVRSIARTKPTVFLNVPRALDMLVDRLDQDAAFAAAMFENLELVGYAGAALPAPVWQKLDSIAARIKGRAIPIVGLWGSTETAPVVTAVYFPSQEPGNIGLPIPGAELKFAPDGAKYEMRVRGPGVTPGYWRQPEATAKAFDEDGFYKMGDAGRLLDPDNINAGILFDGRVAENFKLLSGTWVNVGALRVKLVAACVDLIADAVIAGHDRGEVCALLFPKLDACRQFVGSDLMDAGGACLTHPKIHEAIRDALQNYNSKAGGSSNRIARALLLREPPSIDAGEITDKGYINQRAVLERRAELVEQLYSGGYCDGLIEIELRPVAG
jgi:feruloyl-CoA synthase